MPVQSTRISANNLPSLHVPLSVSAQGQDAVMSLRFFLFYKYFPAEKKFVSQVDSNADSPADGPRMSRDWRNSLRVLRIMAVFILIIVTISLAIIGTRGVPSMEATIWSAILALIALISSSVQFIPQIIRTWKLQVRTSLSRSQRSVSGLII